MTSSTTWDLIAVDVRNCVVSGATAVLALSDCAVQFLLGRQFSLMFMIFAVSALAALYLCVHFYAVLREKLKNVPASFVGGGSSTTSQG